MDSNVVLSDMFTAIPNEPELSATFIGGKMKKGTSEMSFKLVGTNDADTYLGEISIDAVVDDDMYFIGIDRSFNGMNCGRLTLAYYKDVCGVEKENDMFDNFVSGITDEIISCDKEKFHDFLVTALKEMFIFMV